MMEGRRRSCQLPDTGRSAGFVAGSEALVFGLLLVLATIVVLNAWSAIDARFATAAAAREAVRAVVDAPLGADLDTAAVGAAREAFAGYGREPGDLEVVWDGEPPGPQQARCAEVRFRVHATVDVVAVPRWGDRPSYRVVAVHTERIDPFRSGLEGSTCAP